MFGERQSEGRAARDLFNQLRTPDHDITENRTRIEEANQKLQQFWVGEQGLE